MCPDIYEDIMVIKNFRPHWDSLLEFNEFKGKFRMRYEFDFRVA